MEQIHVLTGFRGCVVATGICNAEEAERSNREGPNLRRSIPNNQIASAWRRNGQRWLASRRIARIRREQTQDHGPQRHAPGVCRGALPRPERVAI